MQAPQINQLVFKGTHNSYQCRDDNSDAFMNHSPDVQIDGFGVWAVELDFSVKREGSQLKAVVGHNGPGHVTCWGYYLTDFLSMVRNTLSVSLGYRPVFIYFEVKPWNESGMSLTNQQKYQYAVDAVALVFGDKWLILADYVREHDGQYPTLTEVAGKAVIYYPSAEYPNTDFPAPQFMSTLRSKDGSGCTSRADIERAIHVEHYSILRLDLYQSDWTFEYGVPPNPIVVDGSEQPPWRVTDSFGDHWSCDNGESWRGAVVHEQGTYRYPYISVGKAVSRAQGTTPNGVKEAYRAGFGWTILIRPGIYHETLTIDIPLTLKNDNALPGPVLIGPGRT